MQKVIRFWKIIVLDTLGILCIIAAPLTGWLPGPGGIPLLIIGLSLLSIHHDWAKRYIDLAREYADRAGDIIFIKHPLVQWAYDLVSPVLIIGGSLLIWRHQAMWLTSFGVSMIFLGLTAFLGNRNRWARLKARFKRKR